MTFKGHRRSSEMSQFDRAHVISYYLSAKLWPYLVLFPTRSQILVQNRETYIPVGISQRCSVLGKLERSHSSLPVPNGMTIFRWDPL